MKVLIYCCVLVHEISLAVDGVLPPGGGSTQHLLKLRQPEPSGFEHLFCSPEH